MTTDNTLPATAKAANLLDTSNVRMGFDSGAGFAMLQRAANAFTQSTLVPEAYRGNLANCMIALELAARIGASPLLVMQNLYIVHGNPGWSSKFLIACVNTSGRYTALRYEWRGKPGDVEYGCRCWAIEKSTNQRLDGVWVDWKMVKAEKWDAKSGSKWLSMADQMFVYRAAAFWQRAYAPEISMGLSTVDDLVDTIDVDPDGSYRVTAEPCDITSDVAAGAAKPSGSTVADIKAKPPKKTPAASPTAAAATDATDRATDEPAGDTKKPETETKPASDETPKAEVKTTDGKPTVTFAEANDALINAKTLDELDDAATLIGAVASREHQKELNQVYSARREKLGGD